MRSVGCQAGGTNRWMRGPTVAGRVVLITDRQGCHFMFPHQLQIQPFLASEQGARATARNSHKYHFIGRGERGGGGVCVGEGGHPHVTHANVGVY